MRHTVLFISSFCLAVISRAQDTLLHHQLENPLVITGESVTRTNQESLRSHYQGSDLGRMLAATGEAYVTTYGPPGTAALVRPAGLSPDHAVVSWNGISLNSTTLGMADCSLIPSLFMDHVQAGHERGGGFKPSALGSVIAIRSGSVADRKMLELAGGYNSLNNSWTSMQTSFGGNGVKGSFRTFLSGSHNEFRYRDHYQLGVPEMDQEHNDNNGWGTMLSLHLSRNHRWDLRIDWWNVQRSMHLPARMGHIMARSESQDDGQQRIMIRIDQKQLGRGKWLLGWLSAVIRDDQQFTSKGQHELDVIKSSTLSTRIQNGVTVKGDLGQWNLDAGLMHQFWDVGYDGSSGADESFLTLFSEIRKIRARGISSLWTSWETRENKPFPDVLVRHGWNGNRVGYSLALNAEAGVISRVPDFNERFWNPGGNPDLLPELNRTARLSGQISAPLGRRSLVELGITPFANVITNWIQWVPGSDQIWSARNFRQVRSAGVELKAGSRIDLNTSELRLNASWFYTRALGSHTAEWNPEEMFNMIYAPRHRCFGSAEWKRSHFTAGIALHWISSRYTDDMNSERYALPAYGLFDLFAATELAGPRNHSFLIRAKCENVTDTRYESVRLYATPGRVFSISIVYTLSSSEK